MHLRRRGKAVSEAASIMRTVLPPWILLVSWLLVLPRDSSSLATEDAVNNAAPRIAGCRVGFDGLFKVGHWTPIWVATEGDESSSPLTVEVTTPDNDGVEVTTAEPVETRGPTMVGPRLTLVYVRAGRLGGTVTVRLLSEDRHVLDRRELSPSSSRAGGPPFGPLPSTGELVVQLGGGSIGLDKAIADEDSDAGAILRGVAIVNDADALPINWFGYDGVNVLVLTTSDVDFCTRLAADDRRMNALRKWVELGGRLVVCAGRTAPEWFAKGKPLADLLPGKLIDVVRLPQTQAIESFAGSGDPIGRSGVQQNIAVPRLVDVMGRVEAFGRGNDLPLVVRSVRGFGELVFVGIDLSEPSLAGWSGRNSFLRALLRPYLIDADQITTRQKLVSLGYDDLAGALRQRLGRSFAGVAVIGFPLVAALVIGYVLLLGPLSYLFVEKLVRRPWVAWVVLPLVVLGMSAGAALLMGADKPAGAERMNTAELVDSDLTTGRTRGNCWATLYSPQAVRFDIALEPRLPDGQHVRNAQTLVSWLGLPGSGIGGMHSTGEPIDVTGVGYRESSDLKQLLGLPVLTSSTKSLGAQWDSEQNWQARPPIAAELHVGDDGLVAGELTNDTGARLANTCLLHGQWGYRLGDLAPGQTLEVGPELSAIRVRTIVTRRARPRSATGQNVFLADRATSGELLNLMMFYEEAGGESFAGLPNRYQASCDLSRLLELGRAILVAGGKQNGSQWTDVATGKSLENEQDQSTVVYRFVLPVDDGPLTTDN